MGSDAQNQQARLAAFFKRFEQSGDDGVPFGDEVTHGECWEFQDPENVEWWSLILVPTAEKLALINKYKNNEPTLPVSLYEEVVDVTPGPKGYVCVTCVVKDEGTDHDYRFTYMMEPEKTPFNITPHIASLKNTDYENLAKDVEAHADTYRYKTPIGDQHPAHILAPRLRSLLTALEVYKTEARRHQEADAAITFEQGIK